MERISFEFSASAENISACNQAARSGDVFEGCGKQECAACAIAMFVGRFRDRFPDSIRYATVAHWPKRSDVTFQNREEVSVTEDDLDHVTDGRYHLRKRVKVEYR